MKEHNGQLIQNIKRDSFEHGSIPFWSWNDKLEEQELRRQIRDMKQFGMRGFFMHARGGLGTEYMSKEWFDAVRICIDEAKKQGMEAWAYDENGWPSGFAGGELLKDPRNHACGLQMETVTEFPKPAEDLLGVYAVTERGAQRLEHPSGAKQYTVIRRMKDFSYVDTMNPSVTKQFLQVTHERYKRELGEDFGETMPGFFTDEPQYFRFGTPWSDLFHKTFREKFGYDVLDDLPALFMDYEGAEIFRYDYYLHCHRSYIEGFIKPVYEWCDQNGVKLTGHGIEEWSLLRQMNCCGGVMPFYLYQHIPGIDYLMRNIKDASGVKQLGSVCAQTGKKVALSESFAGCGWDVSPRELKRMSDLQMAGGVNLLCEHLYAYSARGERKRDYPYHFSEHSPWHDSFDQFERHFQHLGSALSQGSEVADTLVIHPMHSAYLRFIRMNQRSLDALDKKFSQMVNRLAFDQIPYHFGDELIMKQLGAVEGNCIRVGCCSYHQVVIPDCETLDSSTVALLKKYVNNGGKVYLWGDVPTRVDGRLADMNFLKSNMTYGELKAVSGITVSREGASVPLHLHVRSNDNKKMIFLANTSEVEYVNTEIRVANCQGVMELLPETLELRPVRGKKNADGSVTVLFDFLDSVSCLLVEQECEFLPFEKTTDVRSIQLQSVCKLKEIPENAMILDRAAVSLNGGDFTDVRPWSRIRDNLLRDHFEGRLTLKFPFQVKDIPTKLLVVVEPMKNTEVFVNGVRVTLGNEWRIDRRFQGVDIAAFTTKGRNEIVMSFDYYQREDVYRVLYGGGNEALRNCLAFDTDRKSVV